MTIMTTPAAESLEEWIKTQRPDVLVLRSYGALGKPMHMGLLKRDWTNKVAMLANESTIIAVCVTRESQRRSLDTMPWITKFMQEHVDKIRFLSFHFKANDSFTASIERDLEQMAVPMLLLEGIELINLGSPYRGVLPKGLLQQTRLDIVFLLLTKAENYDGGDKSYDEDSDADSTVAVNELDDELETRIFAKN